MCVLQLSFGASAVLRHHHTPQPASTPGGGQDGRTSGGRPAEDGATAEEIQP